MSTERAGLAAGLLNTSIQLGGGCGLGVAAAVVAARLPAGGSDAADYRAALQWGLAACVCFALVGLAIAAWGLHGQRLSADVER
jgi:hypothetical protein